VRSNSTSIQYWRIDIEFFLVTLGLFVILILIIEGNGNRNRYNSQKFHREHLEKKIDLILDHLDLELIPEPWMDEVLEQLKKGKKVFAINVYRENTGAGLAEAKAAIDEIASD